MTRFVCLLVGFIVYFSRYLDFKNNSGSYLNILPQCIMPPAINEHIFSPVEYNRTALFSIGKLVTAQSGRPNPIVMETIKQLGILKNKRGTRGGKNYNTRAWDHNQGVNEKNLKTLPQEITCIIKTKCKPCKNKNTQNLDNIIKIKCETLQTPCGEKISTYVH